MAAPIIIPRPDPLTVLMPVWCMFLGLVGAALYPSAPPASTAGIPAAAVYLFLVGLVVGGGSILYGMWRRDVRGLRIKLGANIALGSLLLSYSGWAVQALGFTRPFNLISVFVFIAVASFWNALRLHRALNPKE